MLSSTSPSNARVPWFAVWLLVLAIVTWALGCIYTLRVNPEIAFFRDSARLKQAWARQLARETGPRVFIVGGSSCFTSIDATRLLQRNHLRAINMGLGAGLGAKFLTSWAVSEVKPGDTLILALEPGLLMTPLTDPAMAVQLSYALRAPELLHASWPGAPEPHAPSSALALRPGAYHAFTLIGKLLRGRPLYRYHIGEVQPGGWHKIDLRRDMQSQGAYSGSLSHDAHSLLAWLKQWGTTNNVRVAYSLPWTYVADKDARVFREHSREFLLQIATHLPVLKDPTLGAYTVREHYTDTPMHLDAIGAALRTDTLGHQLTNWSTWSTNDLANLRFSDSPEHTFTLHTR
jgi:hypothetical protein